jgi:cysteine-rich repeat protein
MMRGFLLLIAVGMAGGCGCGESGIGGQADSSDDDLDAVIDDSTIETPTEISDVGLEGTDTRCGNGVIDEAEQCDGASLGGMTCEDLGYTGGTLACTDDCMFDGSGCTVEGWCGDGAINPDEQCDDGNDTDWDGCTDCAITEIVVNSYIARNQVSPDVAAAANGQFVVVWMSEHQDGSDWGIFGQLFDETGLPSGDEFQVNTFTEGNQEEPRVDMAPDGRFVVVWESRDQDGELSGIFGQMFDPDGDRRGDEFQANEIWEEEQGVPDVAMNGTGEFAVSWVHNLGLAPSEVVTMIRVFDDSGEPVSIEVPASEDDYAKSGYPDLVRGPHDNITLTRSSGWPASLYQRVFTSEGTAASPTVQLTASGAPSKTNPTTAIRSDGTIVVVWEIDITSTDEHYVIGQCFDADGEPLVPAFSVNEYSAPGSWIYPGSVASAPDGGFVVTWNSQDEDGYGWGVVHRMYNSSCEPTSSSRILNTLVRYDQVGGRMAMAEDGRHVVVWQSLGVDGDALGVAMLLLDASGEARLPGRWG